MTKKILLVIDNLGSGGAQNQLTLLASGLKAEGHQISVFTYFPQDFFKQRLLESNITHFYKEKNDKVGFGVIKELIAIINKERFDAVISFLDTPNFYAALATRLAQHQPRLIISYRSKTEFDKLSWSALKIKEWTNKCADLIIFNSYHEAKNWEQHQPLLKNKSLVIYNAVVNITPKPKTSFAKNRIKFLVVGTVSRYKNGLLIIEALKQLKSYNSNFQLTWLGRSHFSDNENGYFFEMERKIKEYNLKDHWNWVEPDKNISINTFYEAHDCLILASNIEGLPNVVCEAMFSGMPILISNCLDHPILIKQPENGYTFEYDEPYHLYECLMKVWKWSENDIKNISSANIAKAKELFSYSSYIKKYSNILCD